MVVSGHSRQRSDPTAPLAGVRVLDLTQTLAGPYCTLLLADLGCAVVKIESPNRPDRGRSVPGGVVDGTTAYFASLNRNKRSLALDLKRAENLNVFYRLVSRSHVVVDNFRPGVTARLKIDFDELSKKNSRIVTCSISGFGATGPRRDQPAYDYLIQALVGTMSLTGDPAGPPTKYGISVVDHAAGVFAAFGIVTALRAAEQTGLGRHVDVSLFDTHLSMTSYLAAEYLNCGTIPQRQRASAHPSLVPSQLFETRDGHVVVMALEDHMWPRMCSALGLERLGLDPDLATARGRLARRDEIVSALAGEFRTRLTAEVVKTLQAVDVPVAPVNSLADAVADPQVSARGMVIDVDGVRQVGNPVRISGAHLPAHRAAPALGEHSHDILREAGFANDEIERLCPTS